MHEERKNRVRDCEGHHSFAQRNSHLTSDRENLCGLGVNADSVFSATFTTQTARVYLACPDRSLVAGEEAIAPSNDK